MKTATTKPPAPPPLDLLGAGAVEDFENGEPEKFVPSGLGPLDKLILGAINAELLLIAGAPSQGKTALALQWAVTESQNGGSAAVLSMEMGKRALRNRLIAGLTGVDMTVLRTRKWPTKAERDAVMQAAEYLASIPLFVDDRSGLDGQKVYDAITSWPKQGITLGIVDYIQLMTGDNDSRNVQVGDAVRAIKAGAKAANIPIIGVSAINRGGTNADNRKPKLADLRDSGDLEFVADTILMFHYPEDDLFEDLRQADIHVMKQRNGPTGVVSVQFNKPATRFEERQDVQ